MTAHDEPSAPMGHGPDHQHAPGDPFCVDALRNLYLYLDRELGPDELAAVEAHLHECSPCFEAYDFEAEFRMVISAKGRAPMPPDVRDRLEQMVRDLGAGGAGGAGLGGQGLGGQGLGGDLPGPGSPLG